jgi:pimeloyl-ACP methyl ester carboxylesterase
MSPADPHYDEFGMLQAYAEHEGLRWRGRPVVERRSVTVEGRSISLIAWTAGSPQVVLLHSHGQNAHTWDSVAMALDRPAVAIDLPGHGHSDWRDDHDYGPGTNAIALGTAINQVAPGAQVVVGFGLGGLTTLRLAASCPHLVPRAVLVGVTPGTVGRAASLTAAQREATVLLGVEDSFDSFDSMLAAAAAAIPGRGRESLRPGLLHNSRRLPDGRWGWRYDRVRGSGAPPDFTALWGDLASTPAKVMLVRGARSAFVRDEDVAEFTAHRPDSRVEVVDGAGHAVQSDRPVALAALIDDFVVSTAGSASRKQG